MIKRNPLEKCRLTERRPDNRVLQTSHLSEPSVSITEEDLVSRPNKYQVIEFVLQKEVVTENPGKVIESQPRRQTFRRLIVKFQ